MLIDADAISRESTAAGGQAIAPIADAFGADFIQPDGALDRTKMRKASFSNPAVRARLEAIIHPLVAQASAKLEQDALDNQARCIVFDIPLLVESRRWRQRVDLVLVVDCMVQVQITRVMARSGLARDEVERIIESQAPRSERLRAADIVIFNSGASREQIAAEVEQTARHLGL